MVIECADKYRVRKYIERKGYNDLLVLLLGVWDSAHDTNFEALPNKFVIKCNHGSGYNILCADKKRADIKDICCEIDNWMKEDFSFYGGERHYRYIPRKIIAKKYLGSNILDYKFFCFNGKPEFLYISQEIESEELNKKVKCCFFDKEGQIAKFVRKDEAFFERDEVPSIPETFNKMKQIAIDSSKDFPFVRVDLFDVDGRIYFSELTFTPACGVMPLEPIEWDWKLGELLELK